MDSLATLKDDLENRHRELFDTDNPPVTPDSVPLRPKEAEFVDRLKDLLASNLKTSIIVLIGPQGTGKTTAAFQALSTEADNTTSIRLPTSGPRGKYTAPGTEIVYLSYLTGGIESVTKRLLEQWVSIVASDESRQLVLECRVEQKERVRDIIERISSTNFESIPKVNFEDAASREVVEQLARNAVQSTEGMGQAGDDIVAHSIDIAGFNPGHVTLVAHQLAADRSRVDRENTMHQFIENSLTDTPSIQFADELVVDFLDTISITGGLPIDCLAAVIDAERADLPDIAGDLYPYLSDDSDNQLELRASLYADGVVRRVLCDSSRRTRLIDQLSSESCIRERSDDIARKIVKVSFGVDTDDAEKVRIAAQKFIGEYLKAVCKEASSDDAWSAIANAIDIYCRHGLPVPLSLFEEYPRDLIVGYQILTIQKEYRHVDKPTKRIAANNLGRSVAIYTFEFEDYQNTSDKDLVDSIKPRLTDATAAIFEGGGHVDTDPALVEFYKNVFAETLRTFTTRFPDALDDREIQHSIITGFAEPLLENLATKLADSDLTEYPSQTGSDVYPFCKDELCWRFWTAATAKILFANRHNPDRREQWLQFAAYWTVQSATVLDKGEPKLFLENFYERLTQEGKDIATTDEEYSTYRSNIEHALKPEIESEFPEWSHPDDLGNLSSHPE